MPDPLPASPPPASPSRSASAAAPRDGAPLLALEGIAKGFPGVQALSGVHLELRAGEVHAVVGENGAGKSTLMKLLAGIHQKDAGEIRIDGRPVEIDGPRTAQELGISIIHQEFSLMPDLTIAENIYIGREPRTGFGLLVDDRRLNRLAADLFARLGIELDPRTPVGDLLVAQQQVVEIAKALSFDARILIMDEPTAALTESETANLFRLIRDLRDAGTGVIYISHRLGELKEISDRITVLRDGEYVDTLATADAELPHVISLMVGRHLTTEPRPARGAAAGPVVLEVRGLGTKGLLDDVGFELREGEILGFAGLVGAGRTETARILCGADRADRGTILLRGRQVRIKSPADAARLRIGYLSEDRKRFGLMLDQDVGFNILASSLGDHANALGLVKDAPARRTAERYAASLNIRTTSLKREVRTLSGGNQQKVILARWLARDCDVLIFDEPTRGIDVGAKEEIYALLDRLAGEGKSIIMISSELPEVLRMADRVVVMCEGRVTGVLDAAEADQRTVMDYATRSGAHGGIAT
ncbi:monosaccharide ABC transporter ATP-binding protein, CUT2 family [Glycomyces sambucus]|uniref:Monosaccharide ABC transporter ATP-binding protein, CUT2 family n=1 Tax=Glycomyces sambucus TaxID=380244 RepID=A0A1G9FRE1_9ACTN|nr:sugar ABC transporter ATP-binding protein [Glycomyces sambucus]SDK90974.1 monosaccharide ABC transporter ATP-binding protein, CUT2 family [Glycomyces sambucus]